MFSKEEKAVQYKMSGVLMARLLSRRWSAVCLSSSFTPTRFSSYLPLFHSHSQAESSFDNYIKRMQDLFKPRDLLCPEYQQIIQTYEEDVAAEAAAQCCGSMHVQAAPLLDVLYVSVESNMFNDCVRPPLQVYGIIQLIDEQNNTTYDVYHRESNNPEIVSHGGNLSLTRPDGVSTSFFLPSVSALKMRVHLRDAAAEGKEIAKGDFDIQLMDKTCYHDKVLTQVVGGHGGFASIQYATLPYAVILDVVVTLTKNNDETGPHQSQALIYGTISASSKVKEGSISSVLLNRSPSEPIMVDMAAPMKLSRDVLAVPAYSGIQIKTDLWDYHTNEQIASDVIVANFDACHAYVDMQDLDLGQDYRIKVKVMYTHAYDHVFEKSGFVRDNQKILCGQIHSLACHSLPPDLDDVTECYFWIMRNYQLTLIEVFSIFVSLDNDVTSRICGTIELYDRLNYGENSYCIFDKNKSNPEILDGDMKIKSLKWPRSPFEGVCFGMKLHLTDDVGREVCKGYLVWNEAFATSPISRYDMRVSSVIRGQHGYATVHYSFFGRAITAKVKAIFIPNKSYDVPFKISGDIVARYSNFIYSTYSEKMFFQSTLFGDNHQIIIAGGSPLVLQKSIVPMPYSSSLILDVKLHAQAVCESSQGIRLEHFGSLDKVVDFDVVVDETCFRRVEGDDFSVDVFVELISG